jgi:hypothetical protein
MKVHWEPMCDDMPARHLAPLVLAMTLLCGASAARAQPPPLEDLFDLRASDPALLRQPPRQLLTTDWLADRDAALSGWLKAGIGANAWGSDFNGPVVMNDRNGQGMLNQLALVGHKPLTDETGWGTRVDLLYGTDWWTAVARGLDAFPFNEVNALGVPRWSSSRYYGLALPQFYAEAGREDLSILVGHFYTPLGYEVAPAIGNFFSSRNYAFEYGTPTTHTGILGTWVAAEGVSLTAGIMNGWDNFSDGMPVVANPDYPGANSNLAFVGETLLESEDGQREMGFAITTGNEYSPRVDDDGRPLLPTAGNLTMYTLFVVTRVSERLTWVVEHSNAWQFHADTGFANQGQLPALAQWYGITHYSYLELHERLAAGMRVEWFRDNNGSRVFYPIRNVVTNSDPVSGGFAGNFWAITWGLHWLVGRNWTVRPELRFDWFTPDAYGSGAVPFGDITTLPGGLVTGDAYGQLYGGCDVVAQF